MIEGIDYYPKEKKHKIKPSIWVLLLVGIVAIAFWYFSNTSSVVESQPILIKVSNPKPIDAKIMTKSKPKTPPPEILENLDEVIYIYNQGNQEKQ